jgi:hypothetical protein
MPTTVAQHPTQTAKRALINLNMGIAHTHEIATQLVGMQLSGANVLALIISASSVVAGTVLLAMQRYPTAYLFWVMAGLIGAGLAILIEGLTLGALIRIRLANKAIREVDSRLEEERDEQLATITRPTPGTDPKAYRNAIKVYKMAIATIEQDYRRKRRNATREPRASRGFSFPVMLFGALASATAGGLFYHTILAGIGTYESLALSALFASVVTGTFVSSELFKDIQEHAIREGFAGGSLMDVAMREETKRLSAQVVHQGILDQMQAPEAQAELKQAALEMMRGIIGETFGTKEQPILVVEDPALPSVPAATHTHETALLSSPASSGIGPEKSEDPATTSTTLLDETSPDDALGHEAEDDTVNQRDTDALTTVAATPGQAPSDYASEYKDVLANYPLIAEAWLEKSIKSVSVEEIIEVTGHSRQRVVYHAKRAFARTKNPDRYTLASVLKWLRTAPLPTAGKTGEIPAVSPSSNGHARTTMPLHARENTNDDETDKLAITLAAMREKPGMTDEELAERLGMLRPASARFWRLKATTMLETERELVEQSA